MTDQTFIDIYRKQRINIVPIPKGGGKALKLEGGWGRYQMEHFVGNIPLDQDIAVICGESSDNLIVLDFDECDDLNYVMQGVISDVLNKTMVARTGDGYHVYIKIASPLPDNIHLKKMKQIMELKSQGTYVIGISSEHYDKDESGVYIKTGKKYNLISNVTTIARLSLDGVKLLEVLKRSGWEVHGNISLQDGHIEKITTADLAKGGWGPGERYSSGFRLALRRFHQGWSYETVLNEAFSVNRSCIPPHSELEVERWVSDGFLQYKKNKARPDNPYFPERKVPEKDPDKKKKHGDYAQDIMLQHNFITIEETDEILVYIGGVYRYGGEVIIKKICEQKIPDCTKNIVNEVLATIQRSTYQTRSIFDNTTDVQDPPNYNWINCKNCWVNVITGETREHSPKYLSRIQIPVKYDPEKKCPNFEKFLKECHDDNEDVETILEQFASCLVRNARLGKAYMHVGQGANGKSTLLSVIQDFIGHTNICHVSIHSFQDNRFAKAELDGRLVNIYADISNEELNSASEFKNLVTGDPVQAEKKNKHPFTLNNFAKMFFSANQIPIVFDESDGFFRRFMIIEWNKKFTGKNANINIKDQLTTDDEKSGILNILLDFAASLMERGCFKYADSIEELKSKWTIKSNSVQAFLDTQILYDEMYEIPKKKLVQEYKRFCTDNKMPPVKDITLIRYLKDNSPLFDDGKPKRISAESPYHKEFGKFAVRVWSGGILKRDAGVQSKVDENGII